MDIKGIKLPKLKKQLARLIMESRNIPRGSREAFLNTANNSHTVKVLELYNYISTAKPAQKLTQKDFKMNIKANDIFNKGMLFTTALKEIGNYLTKNNITKNFQITIQPLRLKKPKVFKFKHDLQFKNWVKNFLIKGTDSEGNTFTVLRDMFDFVKIKAITKLKGGASIVQAGDKSFTTNKYIIKCFRPKTKENNCLFTAIQFLKPELEVKVKALRAKHNIVGSNVAIDVQIAFDILRTLEINDITIFDIEEKIVPSDDKKYILLNKSHYYPVVSFQVKVKKQVKKTLLTFDFETRNTEEFTVVEASGEKMYVIKDTILSMYYCSNSKDTTSSEKKFEKVILTTDDESSSARKFIEFLKQQDDANKHYNILAHNGANFDFYLLVGEMTQEEINECEISLRGSSIIGIKFRSHSFKDSYCFLTASLAKLSENYKIEHGKITSINLHGANISSANLCFYKDTLTFDQFMMLRKTDTEFWTEYEKYCLYDSMALYEIWEQFTKLINGMIENINPFILRSCPLDGSMTIGGHSKKILNEINKFKGQSNFNKKKIEQFYLADDKLDMTKYDFLCHFKRGGISHCNQAGNHMSGVVGFDIKSQYPTCLKYARVPCGKSFYTDKYNPEHHGFYHFEYLHFDNIKNNFRPVAEAVENISLNWKVLENTISNQYLDSYMIRYLVKNNGLNLSKSILKDALVSFTDMPLDKLFGKYIDTFYNEKQRQDDLKESHDPLYNNALRETIKLYLNSLTGKLVEEPRDYFQLVDTPKDANTDYVLINGVKKYKDTSDKYNEWLTCGIMVYSYSKQLLFEYINCLPNKDNDVIHIETDGIYFSKAHQEDFIKNVGEYKGNYPTVAIGSKLGNIEFDKGSDKGTNNYFLGKKFYLLNAKKPVMRLKGQPLTTIDKAGNIVQNISEKVYKDVYEGKTVVKSFFTMKRSLESDKTQILSFLMTRSIKPNGEYKLYL